MNFVNTVYKLSENFMEDPQFVSVDYEQIERIAEEMLETKPEPFPIPDVGNIYQAALMELVAASVNYCYWYGKSTVRQLGSNSTKMYELLMIAFEGYKSPDDFEDCVKQFIILLSQHRFPLLEERNRHLEELLKEDTPKFIFNLVNNAKSNLITINHAMKQMISMYPGFASDMFLKRLSLFFIQLNRRFGWFKDDIKNLHVPADYQVPKMLEHFGCIQYDFNLRSAIENEELITKGSTAECEIRAATVLAIKRLCELTDWNVAEVDGYFFLKRHDATNPFHLTITTDY